MFRKRTPYIKFTCEEYLKDSLLKPVPAVKAMPTWFKKLSRDIPGQSSAEPGTIRRCMPVLDAVSQGYIIPLWADMHVKVEDKEDDDGNKMAFVWVKFPEGFHASDVSNHGWNQVGELCDLKKFEMGRVLMKMHNPWCIETSPGWSVQFKNPANNWSNEVQLIEGVVDSDTYHLPIHFPFVWTGSERGEFIIPKGTPMIHLIPFKREKIKMEFGVQDPERLNGIHQKLHSVFKDKYQQMFWHKRKK